MNILFLAPHPFYQERGTPIAVDLVLQVLSERGEKIDVITYHEGKPVAHENVNVNRIPCIPFIRGIRPGFSWKKLICDFLMLPKAMKFASGKRYHVVHAVEESVFMAMLLKLLFKIPYVYDMDSSLPQQIVEKFPLLRPLRHLLDFFEGLAIKNSKVVVPVCDSLGEIAEKHGPEKLVVLYDVSLLKDGDARQSRSKTELNTAGPTLMYVGNLEAYQGINLLLESFALASRRQREAVLVVIGGTARGIEKYQEMSARLGIQDKVHFLGPKPVEALGDYLREADVLVSPRIKGENTPMKIYSYLCSGRPILATDLPTHTQVLDDRVSVLANPFPEEFCKGMLKLIQDQDLRVRLGDAGKRLAEEKYSYSSFRTKLNSIYDWLETEINGQNVKEAADEKRPCSAV